MNQKLVNFKKEWFYWDYIKKIEFASFCEHGRS